MTPIVKNQPYIRERKPINFTMDDLNKAAEESDDKGYESKVIPTTNRSVPTRNCKKNVVYHMDGIESEDEY